MKILLLDNIRSILNVGALFRTCDGAGFEKIVLTGCTPTPPRKEISKTAIGAENFVAWEYYKNSVEYVQELKKQGYKIFVLEQTPGSQDFHMLSSREHENICLILGNEIEGVQKELIDLAHHCIEIPAREKTISQCCDGGGDLYVSIFVGISAKYTLGLSK